ncbi:MAG: NAD(P)/FAD-dependent oxidoreductase, partial [Mycobacteriales bacterium]
PDVVVPRSVLDARLVAAAVARGAELVRHRVRTLEVRAGSVLLDDRFEARCVVGADGAHGPVRRQLAVPRQEPGTVAVAVRGYVASPGGEPEQLIVMDGRDWPAYAWRFDAGDGTANVGFGLLLPSLRAAGRGREALHQRLVELLPEAAGATALRAHHLPLSTGRPRLPDGRVLLAGDAASLVNPLTGEGIFYALLSGRLAGRAAVSAGDAGATYRRDLHRELGRHLRHTTVLARLVAQPRVLEAGVRAADRSAAAMDALVEVGLGRGLITAPLVRALVGEAVLSLRPLGRTPARR